jgi:hypothetical protein
MESMLAANPILKQQLPKTAGNVGIGYAQGALNIGTQTTATENLNAEKAEGEVSQGNLNAAKAELLRQQTLLQQKQAEKAQKESERAQMQGQATQAQAAAQAAAQQAQAAQAEIGKAQADLKAREDYNANVRANPGQIVAPKLPEGPQYLGSYTPVVPAAAPPPPPVYTVSFSDPPASTGNGGSATSAMSAWMNRPTPASIPQTGQMSVQDYINKYGLPKPSVVVPAPVAPAPVVASLPASTVNQETRKGTRSDL